MVMTPTAFMTTLDSHHKIKIYEEGFSTKSTKTGMGIKNGFVRLKKFQFNTTSEKNVCRVFKKNQ